ncbi:MAG: TlpA family protein disulfide reductase [Myxococcota bacterium]
MKHFILIFSSLSLFTFSISCQDQEVENDSPHLKASETVNVPFPDDNTSTEYSDPHCGNTTYPCPPYGVFRYQIIEDLPFIPVGNNAAELSGDDGVAWMHDLFQQHADGKKLLMLTVSAGWCSVCSTQLPNLHTISSEYDEVLFLIVVAQDVAGAPATLTYAENYLNNYDFDNPNVYGTNDELFLFERYMNIAAYPFNGFIDLSTMEIMNYSSGLTSSSAYRDAIDSALSKVK